MQWLSWLTWPFRWAAQAPQALASLSLAARIAAVVGVFQMVVVLLAIGVLLVGGERQVFQAWWRPGKLAVLALLLVLTPMLVYQAARLWLERDATRWPDVLEAWRESLAELHRQGIELADVPVFLVLGATSDEQEKRLFDDAPCELVVQASPSGAAALHVYGGPDAVFVCLASTSQASELARRGGVQGGARPGPVANVPNAVSDLRQTLFVAQPAEGDAESQPQPAEAAGLAVPAGIDPNATISIDAVIATPAVAAAVRAPALSAGDRERMNQRLQYVCELLRRERGALAPLNGVVTLVPAPLLRFEGGNAVAIGKALAEDLATIHQHTGLKSPVTVIVVGLEDDKGFTELVGRMAAGERQSRVGQRFPIGHAPSYEQLGAVAARACGHVEDLILGRTLREKGVLDKPGNRDLAGVVSRLRSDIAGRLTVILRKAFAAADGESTETAPFLAGCYLAACGAGSARRGFVRGVLEKVLDAQGDLEWTAAAEASDRAAGRTARILWTFSGVVLGALLLLLLSRWVRT